jgi:apolipoprotein N-acyltransferase
MSLSKVRLVSIFWMQVQFGDVTALPMYMSINTWLMHLLTILLGVAFMLAYAAERKRFSLIHERLIQLLKMLLNNTYEVDNHDDWALWVCMLGLMWGLLHFNTLLMFQINVEMFQARNKILKNTLNEYMEARMWPCWMIGK